MDGEQADDGFPRPFLPDLQRYRTVSVMLAMIGRTMLPEQDKASWNEFPSISIDRQTRDDSCRCPGGDGRQRRFLHYFLSQQQ